MEGAPIHHPHSVGRAAAHRMAKLLPLLTTHALMMQITREESMRQDKP